MPIDLIRAVCQNHVDRGGKRRTKIEMTAIEDAIHYVTEQYNVITLRGLYYQIVLTLGLILVTQAERSIRRSGSWVGWAVGTDHCPRRTQRT